MYLTQEHDLKFHKLRAVLSLMPPMDRLEKITSGLLWAGFILLTAGLALHSVAAQGTAGSASAAFDPISASGRRWSGCCIWPCS